MKLVKGIVLAGLAVASVLPVAACSGPVKPADEAASASNAQQAPDPNVQVIELPPPVGAKPGEKYHVTISPYPPGSQAAKDAEAAAQKKAAQPTQP